jgi:hypothetical protein
MQHSAPYSIVHINPALVTADRKANNPSQASRKQHKSTSSDFLTVLLHLAFLSKSEKEKEKKQQDK